MYSKIKQYRVRMFRFVAAWFALMVLFALWGHDRERKDKVTLCHKPGTAAEQTLRVDPEAVGGHTDHGDYLGACKPPTPPEQPPGPPEQPPVDPPGGPPPDIPPTPDPDGGIGGLIQAQERGLCFILPWVQPGARVLVSNLQTNHTVRCETWEREPAVRLPLPDIEPWSIKVSVLPYSRPAVLHCVADVDPPWVKAMVQYAADLHYTAEQVPCPIVALLSVD